MYENLVSDLVISWNQWIELFAIIIYSFFEAVKYASVILFVVLVAKGIVHLAKWYNNRKITKE